MNFFKRCWLSILRRPKKSLILWGIVFMLSTLTTSALLIQISTSQVKEDIVEGLGGTFVVYLNQHDLLNYTSLPFDNEKLHQTIFKQAQDYRENKDIQSLEVSVLYSSLVSDELSILDTTYVHDGIVEDEVINLYGVSLSAMSDIENGNIMISEGRGFHESEIQEGKHVIILRDDVMYVGQCEVDEGVCRRDTRPVRVGDFITLKRVGHYYDQGVKVLFEEEVDFKVIGKYKEVKNILDTSFVNRKEYYPLNQSFGYVPFDIVIDEVNLMKDKLSKSNGYQVDLSPTYYQIASIYGTTSHPLTAKKYGDSFCEMINETNRQQVEMMSSSNSYEAIIGPVESLSTIAFIMLLVSMISSVIILSLVIFLFLRERKNEIGIYLSLGERKWKIVTQILLEVYLVGFIGISTSLLLGNALGNQISNVILEDQVKKQQQVYLEKMEEYGVMNPNGLTMEEAVDQVKVSLDAESIQLIYMVDAVVIFLSTSFSTIYVWSIQPKKILL